MLPSSSQHCASHRRFTLFCRQSPATRSSYDTSRLSGPLVFCPPAPPGALLRSLSPARQQPAALHRQQFCPTPPTCFQVSASATGIRCRRFALTAAPASSHRPSTPVRPQQSALPLRMTPPPTSTTALHLSSITHHTAIGLARNSTACVYHQHPWRRRRASHASAGSSVPNFRFAPPAHVSGSCVDVGFGRVVTGNRTASYRNRTAPARNASQRTALTAGLPPRH
jgi:hypothetical protein